jgi:hypothetical protein
VGANTSPVRFHNITRDCQTKSKAIVSTNPGWSAPKTIKDAWQKLLANAMAAVGNGRGTFTTLMSDKLSFSFLMNWRHLCKSQAGALDKDVLEVLPSGRQITKECSQPIQPVIALRIYQRLLRIAAASESIC